jgi:hypothetical protein
MTDVNTENIDTFADGVSMFQQVFSFGTSNVTLQILILFVAVLLIIGLFFGFAMLMKRGIKN